MEKQESENGNAWTRKMETDIENGKSSDEAQDLAIAIVLVLCIS